MAGKISPLGKRAVLANGFGFEGGFVSDSDAVGSFYLPRTGGIYSTHLHISTLCQELPEHVWKVLSAPKGSTGSEERVLVT